jgi:hypothetical protein
MLLSCICIAVPLSLRFQTRIRRSTPTDGAATHPGGRSAGNWWPHGSGTCAWNWGISCILIRCARLNLLLRFPLLHHTRLPSRAMLLLTWARPGKQAAFRAKTLRSSLMGHSSVLLTRSWSRMSNAEKPTEVSVWCMEPAFAGVAPVLCASSASGMGVRRQSRARSACFCILSALGGSRFSGRIGVVVSSDGRASNCCVSNVSR